MTGGCKELINSSPLLLPEVTHVIEQPLVITYENVDSSVTPILYLLTLFSSISSFSLPEIVPPSEVFVFKLCKVKEARLFELEKEFFKGKFEILEDSQTDLKGKGDLANSNFSLRSIFSIFF